MSHSRLPVYVKNLNNIIGICYQKDLLVALGRDQKSKKVKELTREALFINENMDADEIILFFKKHERHLAIVVNKSKLMVGLVTARDVLDELVGEIIDKSDEEINFKLKTRK